MSLETSCDDQKVGWMRRDIYIENEIKCIQKAGEI